MAKKIIVTGANGGLGTFVTQKLLDKGYEVHGTLIPGGPDPEEVKSTFKNKDHLFLKAVDALNAVETAEYVKQTGDVYGAVLTVGGFQMKSFLNTTDEDLDKMISLNFKTAFHFAKPLTQQIKAQKKGHIFFIASRPALEKGGKALTSYSISKHMLIKLAEIVNEEFKGTHASSGVIAPDMIDTIPNRQAMPDANFEEWIKPVEIADAIAFYLREEAQRIREPILKLYGNY